MKNLNWMAFIIAAFIAYNFVKAAENLRPHYENEVHSHEKEAERSYQAGSGITYPQAKILINDYVKNGDSLQFKYNGNSITGYTFTRATLISLLTYSDNNEIFMMWSLQPYQQGGVKYLNLILAPLNNDSIQEDHLAISNTIPYTGPYTTQINQAPVYDVSMPQSLVLAYLSEFVTNGSNSDLYSLQNKKIKAYTLSSDDINALELNSGNANDIFAFIPIIRPDSTTTSGPFENKDYLSVSVGQISNGNQMTGDFRDYCIPCPAECKNYGSLFLEEQGEEEEEK
ncbi:hypothetical protein DNU06_09450 [Putridiphycobacter roseus]|uniref:Uncharacterized protein n=2 Tax=Putridiphycobacter roseus TaxID=2219161 RepID=A0A2W1NG02_9FLAO|nr:hypothetical protein DNU06_09450 [Putridiphycobacter roseus]